MNEAPALARPRRRPSVRFRQSEASFQTQVLRLAKLLGYRAYHTFDSRHSEEGFPDLVLLKPGRLLIVAELKAEDGDLAPEQEVWLHAFRAAGALAYVWRPRDWSEIVSTLRGVPSHG